MPIFEAIQELVFKGRRSEITSKESGEKLTTYRYEINLAFHFETIDPDPNEFGSGGVISKKMSIMVELDKETNEPIIINLSQRKHHSGGLFLQRDPNGIQRSLSMIQAGKKKWRTIFLKSLNRKEKSKFWKNKTLPFFQASSRQAIINPDGRLS